TKHIIKSTISIRESFGNVQISYETKHTLLILLITLFRKNPILKSIAASPGIFAKKMCGVMSVFIQPVKT
ncbi:MAG: hypothetical protein ACTSRA_17915, partial [Promethearchaeota archaeon]